MDVKTHWEKVYTTKAPDAVSWYRRHLEKKDLNSRQKKFLKEVVKGRTFAGAAIAAGYSRELWLAPAKAPRTAGWFDEWRQAVAQLSRGVEGL